MKQIWVHLSQPILDLLWGKVQRTADPLTMVFTWLRTRRVSIWQFLSIIRRKRHLGMLLNGWQLRQMLKMFCVCRLISGLLYSVTHYLPDWKKFLAWLSLTVSSKMLQKISSCVRMQVLLISSLMKSLKEKTLWLLKLYLLLLLLIKN